MTYKQICEESGINYATVMKRVSRKGETFEESFNFYKNNGIRKRRNNIKIDKNKKIKVYNEFNSINYFMQKYNFNEEKLKVRILQHNENLNEAIKFYINKFNNKTILGFTGNQKEICQHFNLNFDTVKSFQNYNNLTFEETVKIYLNKKPGRVTCKNYVNIDGKIYTFYQACKKYNIKYNSAMYYIRKGEDCNKVILKYLNKNNVD